MIIRKFKNLIYSKSIRNEKIINIDNYREFRFAFFGELGYGLICFFPFLYYVTKREGIKLKTIGLKGSVPFFDDFSCDHIELDIQQGDCWGSRELFWNFKLRKSCSEYLIFPDDNTNLNLFNLKWIHTKLSTNFTKNSCFLPLEFEKIQG
ncbi:MAG: hypothetical protein RL362_1201, partial [Bacteroidota bacterium]